MWNEFSLVYIYIYIYIYRTINIQGNSWRGLNLSDGRVDQTLSQEIFKRSCNNFDFVPPMIYDTKAIIWRISFIANIFEWIKNQSSLEESVRRENDWFYGFHWRVKERLIFPFNELVGRKQVCICFQLPS